MLRIAAASALVLAGLLPEIGLAASPDVAISQFYRGGGNTGATIKNDVIEIYNYRSTSVSQAGWSMRYASSTGKYSASNVTSLTSVTPQPGQQYLIQESIGAGGAMNLRTPDAAGSAAPSVDNLGFAAGAASAALDPLPATFPLLGAGLAAVGWLGRRRLQVD
jgi:predicted extracellular nuclease